MSEPFEIEVVVRGVETTQETNYGPRTNRETLATFQVTVTEDSAWAIFQAALNQAVLA